MSQYFVILSLLISLVSAGISQWNDLELAYNDAAGTRSTMCVNKELSHISSRLQSIHRLSLNDTPHGDDIPYMQFNGIFIMLSSCLFLF